MQRHNTIETDFEEVSQQYLRQLELIAALYHKVTIYSKRLSQ